MHLFKIDVLSRVEYGIKSTTPDATMTGRIWPVTFQTFFELLCKSVQKVYSCTKNNQDHF